MTFPVVVPTQFVLAGSTVWLHLVRANPVFDALAENPRVVLSVADDWAFVPSSWKAIGEEDPALGIPTTYYGAVQLAGAATVHDERVAPGSVAEILRRQLSTFQPEVEVADPAEAHAAKLVGHPRDRDPRRAGAGQVQVRRQRRRGAPAGRGGAAARRGAGRVTRRRPATCCAGWTAETALTGRQRRTAAKRRYSAALARLASVSAIWRSACSALWSPMTRATVANHGLRLSTHDSVTRQPASVSSNS